MSLKSWAQYVILQLGNSSPTLSIGKACIYPLFPLMGIRRLLWFQISLLHKFFWEYSMQEMCSESPTALHSLSVVPPSAIYFW